MKVIAALLATFAITGPVFAQCSEKAVDVISSLFSIDHPQEVIDSVYYEQQVPKTIYEVEISSSSSEDRWPAHWVYQITFDTGVCRVKSLNFLQVYH